MPVGCRQRCRDMSSLSICLCGESVQTDVLHVLYVLHVTCVSIGCSLVQFHTGVHFFSYQCGMQVSCFVAGACHIVFIGFNRPFCLNNFLSSWLSSRVPGDQPLLSCPLATTRQVCANPIAVPRAHWHPCVCPHFGNTRALFCGSSASGM